MIIAPAVREQLLKDLQQAVPNWHNYTILENDGSVTYKMWPDSPLLTLAEYGRVLDLIQGYNLLAFTLKKDYLEFTIDLP